MSKIGEKKLKSFTKVGIYKESYPLARYFFDVDLYKEGIGCYYVWRRNTIRLPIYHPLKDRLARGKRNGMTVEEAVKLNENNFYVPLDEIQGIVTYRDHKEVLMLTAKEKISFYFRDLGDYDEFDKYLKENVGDKVHSRDDTPIKTAIYV